MLDSFYLIIFSSLRLKLKFNWIYSCVLKFLLFWSKLELINKYFLFKEISIINLLLVLIYFLTSDNHHFWMARLRGDCSKPLQTIKWNFPASGAWLNHLLILPFYVDISYLKFSNLFVFRMLFQHIISTIVKMKFSFIFKTATFM